MPSKVSKSAMVYSLCNDILVATKVHFIEKATSLSQSVVVAMPYEKVNLPMWKIRNV